MTALQTAIPNAIPNTHRTSRTSRPRGAPASPRLRAAPSFVQALTMDGRAYIAKDSEPYTQYWLDDRERQLLAQFAGRHGATVDGAHAAWLRLSGKADTSAERRRVDRIVREMRAAGVLLAPGDDSSRYSSAIVADYTAHRPFPAPIAEQLIEQVPVRRDTAVLDLAGGPGDLALALARASDRVALMELSQGFLRAATRRAQAAGLPITPLHDSANRLPQQAGGYDLITVSQALHWLDDVAVCRGVCQLLQPDGSFVVIHGVMQVDDSHPLAHLLGADSILGAHPRRPFADEVRPLLQRLSLLFGALDAPDVHRVDPTHRRPGASAAQRIAAARVTLYRQPRPFGPGFARGFFTPQHIALSGLAPEAFWADLEARCAVAPPAACQGIQHWAVLHFQRGAAGVDPASIASLTAHAMAFEGPAGL